MAVRTRKPAAGVVVVARAQCPTTQVAQHTRLCSQSTTASSSPVTMSPPAQARVAAANGWKKITKAAAAGNGQIVRPQVAKTKVAVSPKDQQKPPRNRRLRFGVEEATTTQTTLAKPTSATRRKVVDQGQQQTLKTTTTTTKALMPTRTPFTGAAVRPARAELYRSPGGTDYIMTPGRHRIEMNEFLASFDQTVANGNCPRMRGAANYAEHIHREWVEAEKRLDPQVFLLSYADPELERFRQMAIHSIFNYAVTANLHENTIHLTVLNINRIILSRMRKESKLSIEFFSCTVLAALRNAIKMDESYEKSDLFRIDPDHVWRASSWLHEVCPNKTSQRLNQIEAECLSVLQDPANPPLAPEFLERYIAVGNWPQYRKQYFELASFLLGLSLFSHGPDNLLKGCPSSKLAAAALALAVKVINTDASTEKYEFWPERLIRYTGYGFDDLRPGIRGLAHLLRNKPEKSNILEKVYQSWAQYAWK